LTSILRERNCEHLLAKNYFLQKLITAHLVSIDHNAIQFSLSGNDDDNRELVCILLELKSDEDNLVTVNSIFQNVLDSPNNKETLQFLVNLEDLIPNAYISSTLMQNAFNGDLEAFKVAVEHNVTDAYIESDSRFTAIIWAIIGGNTELLEYIFSNLPLDHLTQSNAINQNLLHYGARYASPDTLKYLLAEFRSLGVMPRSVAINLRNNDNRTPLSMAIQSDSEDKTLILLNNNADLRIIMEGDFRSYNGNSILLKQLIQNKKIIHKIAQELFNSTQNQDFTAEIIIACCKKCEKEQNKLFGVICVLGTALGCLMVYAEFFF
jgi:hypothetical protein